ncbi:MAG: penicillin-binding protein activator LpoB [Vicinamibacterales bacterium]|nr:penicillin-binding protein activator LpoB [Vicinamibacterales bacterium]
MLSWSRRLRGVAVLGIAVCAMASASCGYALAGQGNFLPDYIRVIGIPTLTNQTAYFDIAQIVTDKIRTEFIGRGKYKVAPESAGADAVLNGTITGISVIPTAFGAGQQASRYVITMTANIELRDVQKNVVLWSNPYVTVRDEYDAGSSTVTGSFVDPSAFFNQESNAVVRITDEFSRTVVSSILEAF